MLGLFYLGLFSYLSFKKKTIFYHLIKNSVFVPAALGNLLKALPLYKLYHCKQILTFMSSSDNSTHSFFQGVARNFDKAAKFTKLLLAFLTKSRPVTPFFV